MIDLVRQLSHDQMALLGCAGAFGFALLTLMVSYHANQGDSQTPSRKISAEALPKESTNRARKAA